MEKIFISRDLGEDSIFHKSLTINGFKVHAASLVTFAPAPVPEIPPTDWVFFYSKNAVAFFISNVGHAALAQVKIAAIGAGTAKILVDTGHPPQFIGDGDPARTAADFLKVAQGSRVLFPRARDSRQSIQRLLADQLVVLDMVVYENVAKQDFDLPECQVLVFTSPLNAKSYFSKYKWKGEKVVAIGNTTATELRKLEITNAATAEEPSERALAELVLRLVKE